MVRILRCEFEFSSFGTSDVAVKQILLAKNVQQQFMIEDLDEYHILIKSEEEERIRRMLDTEVPSQIMDLIDIYPSI